jgi:hypothetical protein
MKTMGSPKLRSFHSARDAIPTELGSRISLLLSEPWDKEFNRPIKILGERNTGTNLAASLIQNNTHLTLLPTTYHDLARKYPRSLRWDRIKSLPGPVREAWIDTAFRLAPQAHVWKHSNVGRLRPTDFLDITVIALIRNPVSWLLSLYNNPYHLRPSPPNNFRDFLNAEFVPRGRDLMPTRKARPHEFWLSKVQGLVVFAERLKHLELSQPRISLFENLVTNQEAEFRNWKIADVGHFEEIVHSTKGAALNSREYSDIYQKETWSAELSEADFLAARSLFPEEVLAIWDRKTML